MILKICQPLDKRKNNTIFEEKEKRFPYNNAHRSE